MSPTYHYLVMASAWPREATMELFAYHDQEELIIIIFGRMRAPQILLVFLV